MRIQPDNAYAWGNLGAAHYRNNQLADARNALERANELSNGLVNRLYMAMTAKKLGNDDRASELYDKAIAWIDARETVDELITRLRAEAEGVLGITQGTTAEKEPAQTERRQPQDQ